MMRPEAPLATRDGGLPRFHALIVDDIRHEARDAVSLRFAVPAALAPAYRFRAGQYLTLRATIAGLDLRRAYSICAAPEDGELRVAVKRVDDGAFSTWVNTVLRVGDAVQVMTPTGRFGLAGPPVDGRLHVGFAAGSRITPLLSILRAVLAREPASRFVLFYGSRSVADILFRDALDALKDRYLERFSVFHVLSREQQDVPILNGHLDDARLRLLLPAMAPAGKIDHAYICGPEAMIETIAETLAALGVDPARVHAERFVSAFGGVPRPAPVPRSATAPAHRATIRADGKQREIPLAAGEAILDGALRAGLDLPFACKGGMCATCRARVIEGKVEMARNYSLEPWELAKGFVLTCQARPVTAHVVVDFDQL